LLGNQTRSQTLVSENLVRVEFVDLPAAFVKLGGSCLAYFVPCFGVWLQPATLVV
jgi:hypothetical protein